jgi:hypothetical protein
MVWHIRIFLGLDADGIVIAILVASLAGRRVMGIVGITANPAGW